MRHFLALHLLSVDQTLLLPGVTEQPGKTMCVVDKNIFCHCCLSGQCAQQVL